MAINPQPYPMNREERRKHYKENVNDKSAIFCPRCKHKTKHITLPLRQSPMNHIVPPQEPEKCCIVCVACGNILRTDIDAVPYTYVSALPDTV